MKRFVWEAAARADLRRLDRDTAMRILLALNRYRTTGEGDVKLLTDGEGLYRLRVGKQVEAAALFHIRQPDVSKMLRGEFRQFSVERLLKFLVALDQDVEIVVKPHRDKSNAPALHVS